MAMQPKQTVAKDLTKRLCSASEIAIVVVLGAAGGIGKTTVADTLASFFEAANIATRVVRVETAVRRNEFPARDIVIDLDTAAEAAVGFGGEAAIFEPAWPACEQAIAGRGVVIFDAGANAHRPLLEMTAVTGLCGRTAAAGRRSIALIVTPPEAEAGRQAAALMRDVAERMPEAQILLVVNYVTPAERPGVDTPQARAFAAQVRPFEEVPRVVVPFARAQALVAFGTGQRSMLQIMRATEAELMRLSSGRGKLATASAHAYFGAWWSSFVGQLETYFPPDAR